MNASAAKLSTIPPSPEAELRRLFEEERRLEAELRMVHVEISLERLRYAAKHGLTVYPSRDTLRRLFA